MANIDYPYNITNGTTNDATQVTANFTAIATALNTTGLDATGLQTSAVTTAKIADAAITQVKRAALGQQISSSTSTFTTSSTSFTDVTNATVTITTTGRPIYLGLVSDASTNPAFISSSISETASYKILEGSTEVYQSKHQFGTTSLSSAVGEIFHIYVPSAGTYTYKLQIKSGSGGTVGVQYAKLVAYEL